MNNKIFDAIDAQPDQLRANYADSLSNDITPKIGEGITSVVLAGMGGSALAGDILKNWLGERLEVPFEVVQDYTLPGYLDPHSLVVVSSYSGNTEETLAAYEYASKMNAQIVVMTNGGQLLKLANQHGHWLLQLPEAAQPRFAVLAGLKALACTFEDLGLVGGADLRRELEDAANYLDEAKALFSLDNQAEKNPARKLASMLQDKVALIYAGPTLASAAYKWKININEDAKQMAFCNVFPEFDHNEIEGWHLPKDKSAFVALQLESSLDSPQMQKRIVATKEVLKDHGYDPVKISAMGTTLLDHLLYTILLGDYVSAYLAEDNGVEPLQVKLIEELKKKLVN